MPLPAIDACAFHDWPSSAALVPYMSHGWDDLVRGGAAVRSVWRYSDPRGGKRRDAYPASGPPGSDRDLLVEQLLGTGSRDRVVLGYHDGLLATAYGLPHVARQVVRAVNDWTIAEWLDQDDRLFGQVLIVSSQPEEAAAEIRRVGTHERMVAVALGANTLGRAFGHPVYQPIFAAAAELGLPVVLQWCSEASVDSITMPTAVGPAETYGEFEALGAQSLMAHIGSMIMGGVFDRYPDLQVLLIGGGVTWVPWYCWNMDWTFKWMRRAEAQWLRELPNETFRRHVRLGTYTLERTPEPGRLAQLLETIPGASSLFMYASGYPNADGEEPEENVSRLPEPWRDEVLRENAEAFFRWPARVPAAAEQTTGGDD